MPMPEKPWEMSEQAYRSIPMREVAGSSGRFFEPDPAAIARAAQCNLMGYLTKHCVFETYRQSIAIDNRRWQPVLKDLGIEWEHEPW